MIFFNQIISNNHGKNWKESIWSGAKVIAILGWGDGGIEIVTLIDKEGKYIYNMLIDKEHFKKIHFGHPIHNF